VRLRATIGAPMKYAERHGRRVIHPPTFPQKSKHSKCNLLLTGSDICVNLLKCPILGRIRLREAAELRVSVTMACGECKRRNYMTTKNKKTTPDRLEMKKYCSFCQTHTVHKETK